MCGKWGHWQVCNLFRSLKHKFTPEVFSVTNWECENIFLEFLCVFIGKMLEFLCDLFTHVQTSNLSIRGSRFTSKFSLIEKLLILFILIIYQLLLTLNSSLYLHFKCFTFFNLRPYLGNIFLVTITCVYYFNEGLHIGFKEFIQCLQFICDPANWWGRCYNIMMHENQAFIVFW